MVLVDVMVMCRRRNLSDINNRGKLNLPEFHVAMGLIYRGRPVVDKRSYKLVSTLT
jgi:hypothetical protein